MSLVVSACLFSARFSARVSSQLFGLCRSKLEFGNVLVDAQLLVQDS